MHQYMPPCHGVQAVGCPQQSRLAGTRQPHEHGYLAARDAQAGARDADNDTELFLDAGARAAGIQCRQCVADGLAAFAAGLPGEENVNVLELDRRRHREIPRSFGRLIRSRIMASSTMVNPASNPIPTCTEFSARTTGTPNPPAPTRAAITT